MHSPNVMAGGMYAGIGSQSQSFDNAAAMQQIKEPVSLSSVMEAMRVTAGRAEAVLRIVRAFGDGLAGPLPRGVTTDKDRSEAPGGIGQLNDLRDRIDMTLILVEGELSRIGHALDPNWQNALNGPTPSQRIG